MILTSLSNLKMILRWVYIHGLLDDSRLLEYVLLGNWSSLLPESVRLPSIQPFHILIYREEDIEALFDKSTLTENLFSLLMQLLTDIIFGLVSFLTLHIDPKRLIYNRDHHTLEYHFKLKSDLRARFHIIKSIHCGCTSCHCRKQC